MAYFEQPFYNNDFFNGPHFAQPFYTDNPFFTGLGVQAAKAYADPGISAASASGFTIDWLAPAEGDSVDNYEVKVMAVIGGAHITGSPFTMAGSTLKKVVSGLPASTDYDVIVTAINAGGSLASSTVIMSTTA